MKVVAIVGMPGAGKSVVGRIFEENSFSRIRFGDLTDEELARRGMALNEANERLVREQLRNEHGMAAYARLNLPKIDAALAESDVAIDGLYSWEEYLLLKERYKDNFLVVAVWASPQTRYSRLNRRNIRPLTLAEAAGRDRAEIEKVNKGGPIAMADFTIRNNATMKELETETRMVLAALR